MKLNTAPVYGRAVLRQAKPRRSRRRSNGEVEGPADAAGRAQVERSSLVQARAADQAPRAHTVPRRPRRQTDHASRTPRTIVRSHPHRSPLCACGTAPATEATLLPPELSAPKGRTRTPVAPSEDAYKTAESATVRAPQNKSKHPPSSSRRCISPKCLLTVKLRGRTTTPDERRGRTISSRARGA